MPPKETVLVKAWWKGGKEVLCEILQVHRNSSGIQGFTVRPNDHHHARYVDPSAITGTTVQTLVQPSTQSATSIVIHGELSIPPA
jgi:hypothetical protein